MNIDRPPAAYAFWPDYARSVYDERTAILREGNNIPDDQPMPWPLRKIAMDAAESEIDAVIARETKGVSNIAPILEAQGGK